MGVVWIFIGLMALWDIRLCAGVMIATGLFMLVTSK